mmetsp:Transcript_30067/g.49695  ORF Transcript_30067/g.49695 Transcript_30067/m.49695 type:complete len:147 (+) Transcript_30067:133-573(+)
MNAWMDACIRNIIMIIKWRVCEGDPVFAGSSAAVVSRVVPQQRCIVHYPWLHQSANAIGVRTHERTDEQWYPYGRWTNIPQWAPPFASVVLAVVSSDLLPTTPPHWLYDHRIHTNIDRVLLNIDLTFQSREDTMRIDDDPFHHQQH